MSFKVGSVTVEILEGMHPFSGVPTSQWHGDRQERIGQCVLANLSASDGLRAQVALVTWPGGDEVSLRLSDLFGGPSDYERLEDAGEISPKIVDDKLVARIRALHYTDGGRATSAPVECAQIDEWNGTEAQSALKTLGATRTGNYGDLYAPATRFKSEPAIEVLANAPEALFAVYAITRVMPVMTGFGKTPVDGPNS